MNGVRARLRRPALVIMLTTALAAVGGCVSIGGLIPESGKAGERIQHALLDADLGIEGVGALSWVDNFDRHYQLGLRVEPWVEVDAEFLREVFVIAVPLITHPGIRSLEFNVHQDGPEDAPQRDEDGRVGAGLVDLKAPLEEMVAGEPDKDLWPLSGPEVTELRVRMDVLRDFVARQP